jgi:hypothetical protein
VVVTTQMTMILEMTPVMIMMMMMTIVHRPICPHHSVIAGDHSDLTLVQNATQDVIDVKDKDGMPNRFHPGYTKGVTRDVIYT